MYLIFSYFSFIGISSTFLYSFLSVPWLMFLSSKILGNGHYYLNFSFKKWNMVDIIIFPKSSSFIIISLFGIRIHFILNYFYHPLKQQLIRDNDRWFEERRLMHLVPAPAVRLKKRRVLSRPGVNSLLAHCLSLLLFVFLSSRLVYHFPFLKEPHCRDYLRNSSAAQQS